MGTNTAVTDMLFSGIPDDMVVSYLIGFVIGCLLAAFFSFRFFKLTLVLSGAVLGYTFGSASLGMLLGDRITSFNASLVLGIACAVVFGILAPKFYKALIYFFGGLIGYILGFALTAGLLTSFGYEMAGMVVGFIAGIFVAVLVAKLVYRFFKVYIIITTSFLGSLLMSIVLSSVLFGNNEIAMIVFAILGIVLGVVSARAQFRMNRGRTLNL